MQTITVQRTIDAPIEVVFETVADMRKYSQAVPHVTGVEFLTDSHLGVGTRFRETRVVKGRPTTTEIEVAEFEDNRCIRCVSDTHGTVWDSRFEVAPKDGKTQLTLTMDARAYKLASKIMNPLIRGMVMHAVEDDMDAVQAYCEGRAVSARA